MVIKNEECVNGPTLFPTVIDETLLRETQKGPREETPGTGN